MKVISILVLIGCLCYTSNISHSGFFSFPINLEGKLNDGPIGHRSLKIDFAIGPDKLHIIGINKSPKSLPIHNGNTLYRFLRDIEKIGDIPTNLGRLEDGGIGAGDGGFGGCGAL